MASASSSSSHLAVTDHQKRWLVAGIALNKILVPQIRPFVEQDVDKEYNNLKTNHKIDTQSTSGRLQRWPARKFLKYENINGNDIHPRLHGGRYNHSLFDCRVLSHIDFAKLYVENYMAKFNAFDDHCDASAVLSLLVGVPVFTPAVQAAAGDVKLARNDWAHCVFSKWDQAKFQQSFAQMEHLVRVMALPVVDKGKLLGELNDWENKGTLLCMNSPVDPVLLQLVQHELKSLQDDVHNLSEESDKERHNIRQALQTMAVTLKQTEEMVHRLQTRQKDLQCSIGDANQSIEDLKIRAGQVESRIDNVENRMEDFQDLAQRRGLIQEEVQGKVSDLTLRKKECTSNSGPQNSHKPVVKPEKLVELIRREYKGAVLCPFPWCEDELQLELANIFTRLQIVSKTKERAKLTGDIVNMTDVFRPYEQCNTPRVVLIEGNPGMGKTTYCQKLAYDWSMGDIPHDTSFPKVEILLLLKCRDINVKTSNIEEVIADQLLPQDVDEKEKANFFEFICVNQPKILLILDGLDELQQDLFQSFLPLIKGKAFSNMHVMLTARHEAGMKVRRYCDTLLEIIGYTEDDAENYIRRYFRNHDDPNLADRMITRLHGDNQLRELTTNPLNTALLCLLCEETGGVFPSKETKLYDALVECALRRYFAKRGVSLDGDDPVERCAEQLKQLGKMAFEALLKGQMYFSEKEMKCKSSDFLQLCFLSREPSTSKINPTPCYAFTHKTFQEYFSAFYLVHLVLNDDKGIEALLAGLSPVDSWQVWRFLLTMVTSKNSEKGVFVVSRLCAFFFINRHKTAVDSGADSDTDVDIFEDKNYGWVKRGEGLIDWSRVVMKTLKLIAECEDAVTELMDYQKKMVHVLARCSPQRELVLLPNSQDCSVYSEFLKVNCTISDLVVFSNLDKILLTTVQGGFHLKNKLASFSLQSLDVVEQPSTDAYRRICWIQSCGAKALMSILQSCRFLTYLHFKDIWMGSGGATAIGEFLSTNSGLTHLRLDNAMIFDDGALALAMVLKTYCSLTHLSLQQNWISGIGAGGLAQSLESNRAFEYLNLSHNRQGGDSVAVALARTLETKCSMKYLNLSQSLDAVDKNVELIGPSGGSALGRALRVNCTLTFLNLECNCIGDAGAAAIGEALHFNHTLTYLNLQGNEIGYMGAQALGKALQFNCTLSHLTLQRNKMGDLGAMVFGEALQSNRTLKHLHLELNSIGDFGAAALARSLNSSGTALTRLDLCANLIGSLGATAIAEALHLNCSLLQLNLRVNQINSCGATAVANALRSNRTLTHLNLESNAVDDPGATEMAQTLQYHNDTLRYLNLENNPIGLLGEASLELVDQTKCTLALGSSNTYWLFENQPGKSGKTPCCETLAPSIAWDFTGS